MSGQPKTDNDLIEDVAEFYSAIDRGSLTHKISAERPYVYTTMEIYDASNGIRGAGGLGVLAADTRRVAESLDIPFVMLTPFYREERHQEMNDLEPHNILVPKQPTDFGFEKVGETAIRVTGKPDSVLDIYQKILGSTRFLTMGEDSFGQLYSGDPSSEHRLYQMVSLGFSGYAALKMLGLKPAVIQLNETATVFAAVARLDELCRNGMGIYEAIVYVRKHTLYTNHTLVQAAESEFSYEQFEQFVFPNISSPALKHFIGGLFRNGKLRLSNLTIELAEAKNGVSRLHAKIAEYRDLSGERVEFRAITNGIDLNTWVMPEMLDFYKQNNIVDKFNMPSETFRDQLESISAADIRKIKQLGRKRLNEELEHRRDQYGEVVQIPDDALLFEFKRRFVEYKRPWMPFEDIDELKSILLDSGAHYIMAGMMAGNVGEGDSTYDRLQAMLKTIADDPILRERVHYITDYDESLSYAMSIGSDVSINVPEVGLEACGTSFMKDIINMTILISTNDGGVADLDPPSVLTVSGDTYQEEVVSLYSNMRIACAAVRDETKWAAEVTRQISGYLPIICGSRMIRDYLRFLFKTN
ncbi:glycogen/starch/alpha-glucan phosphorylase [Candidatus Saccharibacteria bacterium]|nr:MAG: glycogen/starch/alpha-glucan phosphorylase [Candidatus Saccharibacteria bacterium]